MAKNLAQQRREEIIRAAHKCFITRGFHATGMADIAREFGMSAGHIYNYFPSKTAIIEEVISRGMEDFYKNSCALQESQDSYEKTLEQVRRILSGILKKERVTLSLELLAEASHNPELEKVLREADVKARTHLKELSNPNGNNAKDWALVDMGMATFEGIGLRYLRNPDMDFDAMKFLPSVFTCHGRNSNKGSKSLKPSRLKSPLLKKQPVSFSKAGCFTSKTGNYFKSTAIKMRDC